MTDANLLLGRLIPDYFPKIFGQSEKEPLDVDASRTAFEKLAKEINESNDKELSLDEIVYGYLLFYFLYALNIFVLTDSILFWLIRFIKVANETMCRPIRALTEARGYATSKHMYALVFSFSLFEKLNLLQTCEFWWSRWPARMRNCQASRYKNHFNPSIQFDSLRIWTGSCRPVSQSNSLLQKNVSHHKKIQRI